MKKIEFSEALRRRVNIYSHLEYIEQEVKSKSFDNAKEYLRILINDYNFSLKEYKEKYGTFTNFFIEEKKEINDLIKFEVESYYFDRAKYNVDPAEYKKYFIL